MTTDLQLLSRRIKAGSSSAGRAKFRGARLCEVALVSMHFATQRPRINHEERVTTHAAANATDMSNSAYFGSLLLLHLSRLLASLSPPPPLSFVFTYSFFSFSIFFTGEFPSRKNLRSAPVNRKRKFLTGRVNN